MTDIPKKTELTDPSVTHNSLRDALNRLIDALRERLVDGTHTIPASALPPATAGRAGAVRLARGADVLHGQAGDMAVTPAGLAGRTATEVRRGLVELATGAEVVAGVDNARAVTPAGLAARGATDRRAGMVELATTAEAVAGSDRARAVTPAGLAATPKLGRQHIATTSGTWIVPARVTRIRITAAGGGGGAVGHGTGRAGRRSWGGDTHVTAPGQVSVTAEGGEGAYSQSPAHGRNPTTSHFGGVAILGAGGAGGHPGAGMSRPADTVWAAQPGQSGGLVIAEWQVRPGTTVSIRVGAAGRGNTGGAPNAQTTTGGNGAPGYVIIDY